MADLGPFVHLHVHSHYSTLDGANSLKGLIEQTKQLGMGAVALTDHGNLFGAYAFQKAAQEGGVKPIIGCEAYFSPTSHTDRTSNKARTRYHFLLLCESVEGYRNLSRLSSLGFLKGYYKPRIDLELLERYHDGLIGTTTCIQGPVCQAILNGDLREAQRQIDVFAQIFGRGHFFVELMDHGMPDQKTVNNGLLELAKKNDLPLIATNDCHYLTAAAHDSQDVLMCISMGKTLNDPQRMRFEQNEFYLKSPDQMRSLFGHLNGAIENTVAIAERCNCVIPTNQKLLPRYRTPDGMDGPTYLRLLVQRGLDKRYGGRPEERHRRQADFELGVIEKMGFVDYFLVVWDFIRWAKDQGIPVGPGRGSGAGSIVAYALEITDLDPLEHGLLFERFLNPERVSMPDFDIDFCFERRGEVIDYVRRTYGQDCVAQIITFGTIKARNAVRDVGRVMGVALPKVDQVAKLIPGGPKVTIDAALGKDSRHPELASPELQTLYNDDPEVRELLDRARGIEGAIRQPGTHAAGVVICDQPLIDLIPLYRPSDNDPDAMAVTQFTMTEVEEIGLLKMDFLGLKNLTIIDRCLKGISTRLGRTITAADIPLDDEATYRLLQQGKGLGVFQLESSGMRDLLLNFKPTRFSDLVALISLYRPGPMDNIPEFIARKEGRREITYDHPDMEPILKETYGLFVYQEQVMQVAQVLAGYSLGGADLLRRAMGKKKKEEMAKQRRTFIDGARSRGIDEPTAERIFSTMEKFAEYGFNKSHAAAYAVITVQTAWLKAHYPVDFYAALMTNEVGGDDAKLGMYFEEARDEGIRILPPDINSSGVHFTPDGGNIRFGLAAIKGVGESAVRAMIEERSANGPFTSLQDFITRVDKRLINSRVVEALISCGAFDAFGHNRPSLLAVLPRLMEVAGTARRDADDPQTSIFDMMTEEHTAGLRAELPIPRLPDWGDKERLETEKELVGFYLTGHPLERFAPDFAAFSTASAREILAMKPGDDVEWVGLIKRIVTRMDKNGRQMAFVECEDMTGPMECTFFADAFDACREAIREGEVIWVRGKVDSWRDNIKIRVHAGKPIDQLRAERIRTLEVQLTWQQVTEANLTRLSEIAARHRGRRKLWFVIGDNGDEVRVEAGPGFGIAPCTALIHDLQDTHLLQGLRYIANGNGSS